jgi:hypothetical protein
MNNEFFKRDTDVARINDDGTVSTGTINNGTGNDSPPSNLKDAILENALGPKKVSGDAGSVEQHSLQDQIAAERFLQSKKATRKPGLGIRLTKLSPDGTT